MYSCRAVSGEFVAEGELKPFDSGARDTQRHGQRSREPGILARQTVTEAVSDLAMLIRIYSLAGN